MQKADLLELGRAGLSYRQLCPMCTGREIAYHVFAINEVLQLATELSTDPS